MNRKAAIMISVFIFSISVTLIDAFVRPSYFVKVPIKIIFFLALPILFIIRNRDAIKDFKSLFLFKWSGICKALLLGIGVYAVILCGYFLTRNLFDYSNVTSALTDGMGGPSRKAKYE